MHHADVIASPGSSYHSSPCYALRLNRSARPPLPCYNPYLCVVDIAHPAFLPLPPSDCPRVAASPGALPFNPYLPTVSTLPCNHYLFGVPPVDVLLPLLFGVPFCDVPSQTRSPSARACNPCLLFVASPATPISPKCPCDAATPVTATPARNPCNHYLFGAPFLMLPLRRADGSPTCLYSATCNPYLFDVPLRPLPLGLVQREGHPAYNPTSSELRRQVATLQPLPL